MKIPEIISIHAKKIALGVLAAAITSVLGYFGYVKSGDNTGAITETQVTNNQTIGDNSDCNTQISDGSGNTVTNNCSTENIDNVERQENIERKIETEQYNENNGSNSINCNRSNGTCGNDGTTNINLGK